MDDLNDVTSQEAKGGNGGKKPQKHPKQRRGAPPKQQPVGSKLHGIKASVGTPLRRDDPNLSDNFKPTKLTTTSTTPRDGELLKDKSILVEGIALQPRRQTTYYDDYSHYLEIVRASYRVHSKEDKRFTNAVSQTMYEYYCTILLWERIILVLAARSDRFIMSDYDSFLKAIPPTVTPVEIGQYLDGIGHIQDLTGAHRVLELQTSLVDDNVPDTTIRGWFGPITQDNHYAYETVPAPAILIMRMGGEYMRSFNLNANQRRHFPVDWDLPEGFTPSTTAATLHPTPNLLGWMPLKSIATSQQQLLTECGFINHNNTDWRLDPSSVRQVQGMTVLSELMTQISLYLSTAKRNNELNNYSRATTAVGSISQMMFSATVNAPTLTSRPPALSTTAMTSHAFSQQFSIQSASVNVNFRYRIKRVCPNAIPNMLSYLTAQFAAPNNWMDNADHVYEHSDPLWNMDRFLTSEFYGNSQADAYVGKVRKVAQEE